MPKATNAKKTFLNIMEFLVDRRLLSVMFFYPMTHGTKIPYYMQLPKTPGTDSLIIPEKLVQLVLKIVGIQHKGTKMDESDARHALNALAIEVLNSETAAKGRSQLSFLRQLNRELGGGFFANADKTMAWYTQRIFRKSNLPLAKHEIGYMIESSNIDLE